MRHLALRFVGSCAALGLLFAACDDNAEGSTYAPDYLPGTRTVWVGRRLESYNILSANLDQASVQDVHHDTWGDYVTVRIRWSGVPTYHPVQGCSDCSPEIGSAGSGSEGFFVESLDGVSWHKLEPTGTWLSGLPVGLFRARNGVDALAIGLSSHRGIGNAYYRDWYAQRVDLRSGAWIADPVFDHVNLYDPHVVGFDHIAGVYRDGADYTAGASAMTTLDAWAYPMADGTYDFRALPSGDFRSVDGATFTAYTDSFRRFHDGGSSMDICRVDVAMVGDHTPVYDCRGVAEFPPPFSQADLMTHVSRGRVLHIASDAERTWAVEIAPGEEAPRIYDLGPGVVAAQQWNGWRYDLRQRYGELVRLVLPDGSARFVDLLADGRVQEVALPLSPCRNDCAADLAWVTPLGDDMWRVFYTIYDLSAAHAPLIVARDVTAPPTDATDVDTTPGPLPGYPDATPAGGLERACLAITSCHPSVRTDACVMAWSGLDGPAADAFAAAADKGCAALDAAWVVPSLIGQPCPPIDNWCVGNAMVTECSGGSVGTITKAEDCGVYGTTCTTERLGSARAACTDGSARPDELACDSCTEGGNAIHCVLGNGQFFPRVDDCARRGGHCAMAPSAVCVPDGECPATLSECDGDTAVSCNSTGARVETSCPYWGGACHLDARGYAVCEPREELECVTQAFRMACVGTVAAWCTATRNVHYVDCKALGFSGCADDHGVPVCTP